MGDRRQENADRSNERIVATILIIVLLASLLLIVFQDVKYREIHILLPLAVFITGLCLLYLKGILNYVIPLYNVVFFLFIFSVLILYMSIKNKSFLNPFAHYFGLGDLLYFIGMAPFFLLYNYVFFFIVSMLFSIALQLLFKKWMKDHTVPLAGFSALLLMMAIGRDLLFDAQKFTLIV